MGFFSSLFKKDKKATESVVVYAPAIGEAKPLSFVEDGVFSEKVLGTGFVISDWDGKVYAPISGVLKTVFPTGHAYGIESKDGLSILIHIGIDTVNLNGEGFKSLVKQDQEVKKGDLLAEVDLELLKKKGVKTEVITVVTSDSKLQPVEEEIKISGKVSNDDVMIAKFK